MLVFFHCSSCELSDEGRYVILYVVRGAEPKNKLYYCDLGAIDYKIEGRHTVTHATINFTVDKVVTRL